MCSNAFFNWNEDCAKYIYVCFNRIVWDWVLAFKSLPWINKWTGFANGMYKTSHSSLSLIVQILLHKVLVLLVSNFVHIFLLQFLCKYFLHSNIKYLEDEITVKPHWFFAQQIFFIFAPIFHSFCLWFTLKSRVL